MAGAEVFYSEKLLGLVLAARGDSVLNLGIGQLGLETWVLSLRGLGSGGDSKGAEGAEVLDLVRGVSGSPSADLVKEEAVSMV